MCLPFNFIPDANDPHSSRIKAERRSGYLVDLSEGGMRICGDMLMEADLPFAARLEFPDEMQNISFRFRVKWITKNSYRAFGKFSYGIEITTISAASRRFLEDIYSREQNNTSSKAILKN
jgi:hypothetical protein